MALVSGTLTVKITYLVDKGNMFNVVFLDISKAAYAILHNIFECFIQL